MASLANLTPISLFAGDIPSLLYDEESKAFAVNPDKSLVKWQWMTGQVNNVFPIVLGANAQVDATVRVGAEEGMRGDTEVSTFMLTRTGRLNVMPYVGSIDKYLSNVPIPDSLMFGTAQLPGLLPMTLYNLPTTFWRLTLQEMTGVANTVSPVFFGRRFLDRSRERLANERRVAFLSQFMHTYWLGAQQGYSPAITIAPGATLTVTLPVPSSADLDCRWILDDSTSTTGLEPVMNAQIFEGESSRGLIGDQPNGIAWRDFIASPTVTVAGFPSGGFIRSMSLPSPGGCWSHLFKRSTNVRVQFTSADAGTITLRFAFVGTLIYASEPLDRQLTQDTGAIQERIAQSAARGAQPVAFYGQR